MSNGVTLFTKDVWILVFSIGRIFVLYCQDPKGGLWDKPGKKRDLYHTCYSIAGLSSASQFKVYDKQN